MLGARKSTVYFVSNTKTTLLVKGERVRTYCFCQQQIPDIVRKLELELGELPGRGVESLERGDIHQRRHATVKGFSPRVANGRAAGQLIAIERDRALNNIRVYMR